MSDNSDKVVVEHGDYKTVRNAPRKRSTPLTKSSPEPEPVVWFESREQEPRQFNVAGVRSIRNFTTGRVEWEVPASDVERFERNHFVRSGRVVRKRA